MFEANASLSWSEWPYRDALVTLRRAALALRRAVLRGRRLEGGALPR